MSLRRSSLVVGVPVLALTMGCLLVWKPWSNADPPATDRPGRDEFASDRPLGAAPVPFNAARALGYLETLCRIGPRVSGTPGMKQQQDLLQKHFEGLGGVVRFQRFSARQQSRRGEAVDMANLVVSWFPDRRTRVILCSHYDTRPIADQEPDRAHWTEPFLSANDGGSGVALLMELAHHVKDLQTPVGIDFVCFDGEEYVFEPNRDHYFFGSEHFAAVYQKERPPHRYLAALLFDMIGGKNARFPIEQSSWTQAGALVESVWRVAAAQRCELFRNQLGYEVRDDHLALNRARIPAIDIIDFDYPHWHRLSDLPANCSGETLGEVARVVVAWLQQLRS